MAELRTDAANALLGEIAMWMMSKGVDGQEARAELYLLMHGYENVGTTQIYLDIGEDDLNMAHKKYVT